MTKKNERSVIVIGSGISGLSASFLLDRSYDVTLIEADDRLGGHTHTISVDGADGSSVEIDTGFIVFNTVNYPLFTEFLRRLNVPFQSSDMSFGFYDAAASFWYSSDIPWGVFSQKRHIFSPSYWKFLRDITTFNRCVLADLDSGAMSNKSLGDYCKDLPVGRKLIHAYLLPMGAAIWSCPTSQILTFPAESFFSFWRNHRLLSISQRPTWQTVSGGSRRYIDAFLKQFNGHIRYGSAARTVDRRENDVVVHMANGQTLHADHVVIATHADQALGILANPTMKEQRLLGVWKYTHNTATLHTDHRVMPPRRNAWSSWLVHTTPSDDESLSMTYYMNRLHALNRPTDYFVTLNDDHVIDSEKSLAQIRYTHPVFDFPSVNTQAQLNELHDHQVSFCGSYFGYGFHEDGIRSAVDVCKRLGCDW